MEPSVAGALICGALLWLGFYLGSPAVIGLFASIPFAATAIVTLTTFGGSSPLIWTVFAMLLLLSTMTRRDVVDKVSGVFNREWLPWNVLFLTIYVNASAWILPRLYIGQTTVFVPINDRIAEVSLAPLTGNFTQAAYFTLGALTFYALCIFLREPSAFIVIRRGFFAFASIQVALGSIDIVGKLAGLGDLLYFVRTANYTMLTHHSAAGFWRVVGGGSEASVFAAFSVTCLVFVFTYWRGTGCRQALILTLALAGLLLISTSTTAYVALTLIIFCLSFSLLYSVFSNRISKNDVAIVGIILTVLAAIVLLYLVNEKFLGPFADLINSMVFEKHASSSGAERAYWITRNLQSVVDTAWLGVGIGSSRSSSWIVAVLSQLGIIGTIMMGMLVWFLLVGVRGLDQTVDNKRLAIVKSTRAAGLASLLTLSISGGMADPGIIFFISLAVVLSCRQQARRARKYVVSSPTSKNTPHPPPLSKPEGAI